MSFLPYENFTITTNLDSEEVKRILADVIEPPKTFRNSWSSASRSHKPYEGKIYDDSFQISRIIHTRNSFLPIIKGKISPQVIGCSINITMKLHIFVLIFMGYWLSMTGSIGVGFLLALLSDNRMGIAGLMPLGMFVFGCLLCIIPFKIEAKKSKEFLYKLFSA